MGEVRHGVGERLDDEDRIVGFHLRELLNGVEIHIPVFEWDDAILLCASDSHLVLLVVLDHLLCLRLFFFLISLFAVASHQCHGCNSHP